MPVPNAAAIDTPGAAEPVPHTDCGAPAATLLPVCCVRSPAASLLLVPSSPPTSSPPVRAPLGIRLDRAITLRAGAILGVVLFHAFTVPYGGSFVNLEGAASQAQGTVHRFMMLLLSGLPGFEQFVIIFFIMSGYFAHRAY
jgi:hypothetical protein